MADYTEEYYMPSARIDLNDSDHQQVARYVSGLKEPIQDHLALKSIWTLSDAVNLAYRAELQLAKSTNRQSHGRRIGIDQEGDKSRVNLQGYPAAGVPSLKMTTEGNRGEAKLPTIPRPANPYARPAPNACFRCGKPGHRSMIEGG